MIKQTIKKAKLSDTRNKEVELSIIDDLISNGPTTVILFSIDLTGSTKFKSLNDDWPDIFFKCFLKIEEHIKSQKYSDGKTRINAHVLKYAGDEVIFLAVPRSDKELYEIIQSVHRASLVLSEHIHNFTSIFVKTISGKIKNTSRTPLGLKITMWSAIVSGKSQINNPRLHSLIFSPRVIGAARPIDIIGTDMDCGFRLSKFAFPGITLLSVDLAYMCYSRLYGTIFGESQIRLSEFQILKGIWNDKPYPILFFSEEWDDFLNQYQYPNIGPVVKEVSQKNKYPRGILFKTIKSNLIKAKIAEILQFIRP